MSDHRRHHYVPRFYQEMFAARPGAVGIYAIAARKLIPQAPIKRQAYRNYFYGTEGRAEKLLGEIENNASPAFARILSSRRLPVPDGPDHHAILFFLSTQHCRTVRAEAQHKEGAEKSMRAFLRKQAELEGNQRILDPLGRVRITRTNAITDALQAGTMGASLLTDLAMLLIENESQIPFIASDAPVVLHNRLFEDDTACNAAGYGSVGLQIALPLGPRTMLFCYDPAAYRAATDGDGMVRLADEAAVITLNELQWEVAEDLLFVSPDTSRDSLDRDADRWTPLRGGDRMLFHWEEREESGGRVRVRQGVGEPPSVVRLSLPFLTEQLAPARKLEPFEAAPVRDPFKMDLIAGIFEGLSDLAEADQRT